MFENESAIQALVTRLSTMFRSLPKDMFVECIIRTYHLSETSLEDVRSELFEHIKSLEEFPYNTNTELKKRLHTRNGDSVVLKLSRDIYILLSVIEGADFSDLQAIMSITRQTESRRSVSVFTNVCIFKLSM